MLNIIFFSDFFCLGQKFIICRRPLLCHESGEDKKIISMRIEVLEMDIKFYHCFDDVTAFHVGAKMHSTHFSSWKILSEVSVTIERSDIIL